MGDWKHVGELEIRHNKAMSLPFYPEDEGKAAGWKMDGSDAVWAQALLIPGAKHVWALALAQYLGDAGYMALVISSQTRSVVLYRHPALLFDQVSVFAVPKPL